MSVHFHEDVEDSLLELIEILYIKEYFGFKEAATSYVRELMYDIRDSIARKHKKAAPDIFSKYGYGECLYYVSYRKNKNTQWYVFFTYDKNDYYVNYITNNHVAAQFL